MLSPKARRLARANKRERQGALAAAVELYLAAAQPEQAARVLLLQADAERSDERRLALLARAGQLGANSEVGRQARRRQALMSFDVLRQHHGGVLRGEMLRAAAALERAGCYLQAAQAFKLADDEEGEIRALQQAGAIDQLEARLQQVSTEARQQRQQQQLLQRIRDLDAIAERRNALEQGRTWLQNRAHEGGHRASDNLTEEALRQLLQQLRDRLLRGPQLTLTVRGETRHYVLGSSVTVGRAGADIEVASQAISRQHLRLYRGDEGLMVEDMRTRNGTTLAGARLSAPLSLGGEVTLMCAGQVPCTLTPTAAGLLQLSVGGECWLLPLGPLHIGDWEIIDVREGEDRFVVLRTPADKTPPHTDTYRLGPRIELCRGDQLRLRRDGPVVLAVPTTGQRSPR